VRETVDVSGRVRGTASPAITPDWRPDPRPAARIDLDRADLQVLGAFPVSVRGFLQERLNPVLDQELKGAAGKLLSDLALRRKAEEAWRSLHVARRAVKGENLWIRFQPLEISLARLTLKDGVLHAGIGAAQDHAAAASPRRRRAVRRLRGGGAGGRLARGALAVGGPGAPGAALPR
jgi:hypothetical protein